jgi:hypothetical protein
VPTHANRERVGATISTVKSQFNHLTLAETTVVCGQGRIGRAAGLGRLLARKSYVLSIAPTCIGAEERSKGTGAADLA